MMHEFWANAIEVGIASFLLYRSLGIAFLAPLLVLVVVVGLAAGLSTFVSQQTPWVLTTFNDTLDQGSYRKI